MGTKAEESWEVWWNNHYDYLRTTGFWGKVVEVILSLRFFLIQYGVVYRLHIASNNKSIIVYLLSWLYILGALLVCILLAYAEEKYSTRSHLYYRTIQLLVTLFIGFIIILLLEMTPFQFPDLFLSLLAFIPTGWGLINICLVMRPHLVKTRVWPIVVAIARLYEFAIGIMVMIPLGILSWFPGFQKMQTRILFNQAFLRGLHIQKILDGKLMSKRRHPWGSDSIM